jgi:hypothetical protein
MISLVLKAKTFARRQGINSLADFRVKLPYIGTAVSCISGNLKLPISSKTTNQKRQKKINFNITNQVIGQQNLNN